MEKNNYFPYVLETHLVDHCNLVCKGCSHFSSLLKQKIFANINVFKRDFSRMKELFDDIYEIRLMGGEPLLHPNINEFMVFTRHTFPYSKISIYTNGKLLLKMQDSFWNECRDNNILIKISLYPIDLDVDGIIEKAKSFGVPIKIPKPIDKFYKLINIEGDSNPAKSFKTCRTMYTTPFLRDGKLYSCALAPNIHFFNDHFGKEIPLLSGDSVDIYQLDDPDKIIEFLKKPIPMCRWCLEKRDFINWGRTKKDISEWVGGDADPIENIVQMTKYKTISIYHKFQREIEIRTRKRE